MANDVNDPRPQAADADATGGLRRTEPRGPYVDQAITVRNLEGQAGEEAATFPAYNNDLEQVPVYDQAGTKKSGFTAQPQPPTSPNSWRPGRDLYANGGGVGQSFLNNPNN